MKNSYRTIDYTVFGLPYIEVHGDKFLYLDLYELVGRHQFMTTFNLKEDSEAHTKYGASILGVIHINHTVLKKIESSTLTEIDLERVQIYLPEFELSEELRGDLKYQGIKIADIEFISFLPYERKTEVHDTGEKKVPNIIEVKVDFKEHNVDEDKLQLSLLTMKNNHGIELIYFEKEQIIGLTRGINDGHIDSRILAHFGFDKESMENNHNIWLCYFKMKEKRNSLSEQQKERYLEIQNILSMKKITKILKEITKSNIQAIEIGQQQDTLKVIIDSAMKFRPSILSLGKKQIYWDLESYLHIVIRHVKDYQIGDFKKKTPFSYKPEELKLLIEKVINCIKNEYQTEKLAKPDKIFTRQGKMAVRFNGDYYNLRIEPDGRLRQFHALESINTE